MLKVRGFSTIFMVEPDVKLARVYLKSDNHCITRLHVKELFHPHQGIYGMTYRVTEAFRRFPWLR